MSTHRAAAHNVPAHTCLFLHLCPVAASLGFNEGSRYDARLRCGHASCPNSSAKGVPTSLREMEPAAEGDVSITTARLAAAQVPDTPLLSACSQGQRERGRLPLTSREEKEDVCIDQSLAKSLSSHSTGTESCKRGRQKHPAEAMWQVQDSRAELGREAQKDKPCYNINKFPV